MSAEQEYELFSDPRRVLADGAIAKQEQRERLGRIFAPPPEPESADAVLDELVGAVAERIVERVQAVELEPEPEGPSRGSGFDGGARRDQPRRVETHDETLVRILRTRAADRGVAF
jgi:hypothetical protein